MVLQDTSADRYTKRYGKCHYLLVIERNITVLQSRVSIVMVKISDQDKQCSVAIHHQKPTHCEMNVQLRGARSNATRKACPTLFSKASSFV